MPEGVGAADKWRKKRVVLAILAAAVFVAAGILIAISIMKPNYTQVDTLKAFIAEQVASGVPYSTVELSGLTPNTARALLSSRGIDVEIDDAVLQEVIGLYLADYFEQYAVYDVSYDIANDRLVYRSMEVETFYDSNQYGTFQTITWYGSGSIAVFIERDARGTVLDISAFDAAGEYLTESED